MDADRDRINEKVKNESRLIQELTGAIRTVIVGQEYLIERLMVGLLANGHILVESVPGLAKTLSIMTLSQAIKAQFQRIQFTPDLLPADIVGTLIYNAKEGTFEVKKGPVFSNIVLADEINRAPGKVQAALLEAMQERQVTIGTTSYRLEEPFLVMATQNPIDQEGTYPLPEAQVDRFMLKVKISYLEPDEEIVVLDRMGNTRKKAGVSPVATPEDILKAREIVDEVYVDDKIKRYIVDLVFATRRPEQYGLKDLKSLIQLGASPRATIALVLAAKAFAFLRGRGYITPQDIREIGYDVLRHRIMPSYEAEAEEMSSEDIIKTIFDKIPIP
ncbi:MAG: MoxR family ATPase [Candidatus Omnitrophica bacterium]|nr:MoxR family ATPase [Candidatus Omnitrophota bacterium]MDD5488684.1 MoxR family ATPase [Candidatus Omnitrophota bacterium]